MAMSRLVPLLEFNQRFKVAAYRTRVILWSLFCLDPIVARMQMPVVDDLNPPIFEAAARRRCLQLARSAIGTTQLLLFGVQSISEVDADKWFVPNDPRVMPRRNRPPHRPNQTLLQSEFWKRQGSSWCVRAEQRG